jgi:transcriptional regulator with XRE-family HTH domain
MKNSDMEQIHIDAEHQEILKLIGKRVKELRTNKKIKIKEISAVTNLSRNSISQIEHGQTYFKISALLRILDYHQIFYLDFMKTL